MSWLEFILQDKGRRKTDIWAVMSRQGEVLGYVKWYPQWRQYTFTNWNGRYGISSVWNPDCLEELTEFIRTQMKGESD